MTGLPKLLFVAPVLLITACSNLETPWNKAPVQRPSGSTESSALSAPPESLVSSETVIEQDGEGTTTVTVVEPPAAPSEAQRQADVEACFAYARARVDNDLRINSDIGTTRPAGVRAATNDWNRQVDSYYYKNEQSALFDRCMRDKGYSSE